MRYLVALLLLLVIGCDGVAPQREDLTAHAAVTLAANTSGLNGEAVVIPDNKPEPVNDVCENCGGTGKLGDGRVSVTCPVCDGTGKTNTRPLPEPVKPKLQKSKATIRFYTGPGCIWCEKWKQKEIPKLVSKGWQVETHSAASGKLRPYFDILLPGRKAIRHDGYLSMQQLKAYMGIKSQVIKSSYVPRWQSNDGLSFEEHARIYHGIDTHDKSFEQIARMRDADHDKFGGGHPVAMRMQQR